MISHVDAGQGMHEVRKEKVARYRCLKNGEDS